MKPADNKGVFDSPHAQIVDSFNVYRQKPPPADHPNAIVCEQCSGFTWRLTKLCMHCKFDIYARTQELIRLENLDKLRFEQQQLRKKLLPLLVLMLVLSIGGAITIFYLVSTNPFISWILIAVMAILLMVIKPLTEKMENIRNQIRELE